MMTVNEIRQAYLDFFEGKGHHIVPSAPMVIKDDPTLMFTNAGMNQFKDIILGNAPIKYPRVADSQKCLRVSGKHNDLEEVGKDTYHHTMFEMLGNWSFGDYFKAEMIPWAWELLTEVYKLPKGRLYVTIFEGAPDEGLERDKEAYDIWSKLLPSDRIIDGNKHDNFWEMGETGPCGPCSEIHIDLRSDKEREEVSGRDLVNHDHPQVIEIWNLVFMQFSRLADGHLEPLPNKVIDTGMGLERLCMALQGVTSNYDTDVFKPLIEEISALTGLAYGQKEETDIAMRVIADHVRTIAFSVTDGQLPSNAKAGYVIRRILRRAVRYAYTFLGQKEPFMYKLLPTLSENMGGHYPELKAQEDIISKVLMQEEQSFLRTLETGIQLLEGHIERLKQEGKTTLEGETVFLLYDTYGFPADLTELILSEQGLGADLDGFANAMQAQKDRARSAAKTDATDWVSIHEGETEFVGYDLTECDTTILRFREVVKNKKKHLQAVLGESPFYAEMGGQVGDTGTLRGLEDGQVINVLDTIRENNLPIAIIDRLPDDPTQTFRAEIDTERRRRTEANHSGTHLLHEALREVLGTHVEQKGSFVSPEELRFDFSHFSKMTDEEIRRVEERVTEMIRADYPRDEHRHVPIEKAKAMGAMALFGEKYGEDVRVIRYGDSVELCGGTHIPSTGMIGTFRILSESSIASGIRRITAVTGVGAEEYLYAMQDELRKIRELFPSARTLSAIEKMQEENAALKKEVDAFVEKEKNDWVKKLPDSVDVRPNGVRIYHTPMGVVPAAMAKDIAFGIKAEHAEEDFAFVAASKDGDKATLTLMLSDSLVAKGMNAGTIVREAAKLIQGGGGGQPGFATAGGKNPDGIPGAVMKLIELLSA
ncbi:MAG: alanine--tRNA ligase [Porphyromonas sp.]|nr:alanine--tRNA ligase [Bacteroidales bacterium]MDY3100347.1 alanine--tRNA ligase [Porphyromonas sp.]